MTKAELLDAMKDAPMDAEVEIECVLQPPVFSKSIEDSVRSVFTNTPITKTHWVLISNRKRSNESR